MATPKQAKCEMLTHWCYYNQTFFDILKQVEDNSSLNPVQMSVKQWYNFLLEEYVTMVVIDDEGRQQAKCAGLRFLIQIMNGQNPSTCPGCVDYLQKPGHFASSYYTSFFLSTQDNN